MRKNFLLAALCSAFLPLNSAFAPPTFAAPAASEQTEKTAAAAVEEGQAASSSEEQPTAEVSQVAAEPVQEPAFTEEVIDTAAMAQRLAEEDGDVLYVDADGSVTVYYDSAADKGLRTRIAAGAPLGVTLRLYTNNKDTFLHMYKTLQKLQGGSKELGAYRILTDRELNKVLKNGTEVYRCWFMRVPKEKGWSGGGLGIGLGFGFGGGHHYHHHHGPFFGIGPWW